MTATVSINHSQTYCPLTHRDGDASKVCAIPDALRPYLSPAQWMVFEWTPYLFVWENATRLRIGSTVSTSIVPGVFQVSFENQLGLAAITACDDFGPIAPPVHVEVIAAKFSDPVRSVDFLKKTLDDLFARVTSSPFMLQAATERMVRESLAPPSALFTFHFFRWHGEALGRALQAILGRPHQQLTTDPRLVRPHEVRQIDRDSMVRMLRAGHPMPIDATNRTAQLTPLQRLRPERVWQQIPLETYDTPENRFVLEISRRMLSAVQVLRQAAWYLRADIEASMRRRLDESAEHLAMLTMDDRFASLGRMTVVPSQSRVLQRRDGYRELTELWHLFQRSRQPLFERMQQAIDLRDIATLYELWLWFELIDRVQAITGVSPSLVPSLDAFGVPGWTSQARFGDHGSLFYNRTFKGYSGIWLRPDYVWERPDGTRVVMDAKFRMQRPTELIEESTGATTLLADQRAKDDDLQKMHVYCDAIEHVNAAIVLYPGHITTFRNRSGDRIQIGLADALAGGLQGIGALPMSPIAIGVDKE